MPPAAHSVESLNPEELAGSGVKVDTLKVLFRRSKEEDGTQLGSPTKMVGEPPKLISLDQVTMRGEDLTGLYVVLAEVMLCVYLYLNCGAGLIFAQFPSPSSNGTPGQKFPSRPVSAGVKSSPTASPAALLSLGGYNELGDGQVMEVLSMHLKLFEGSRSNDDDDDDDEEDSDSLKNDNSAIILYKEAIEHCARLYRVMVSE